MRRPRLPQRPRPQAFVAAVVVLGVLLLSVVLAAIVTSSQATSQNTAALLEQLRESQLVRAEQSVEHRRANQQDHDCIVALNLIIGDPQRNLELPPNLPPTCRTAPAADAATNSSGEPDLPNLAPPPTEGAP